MTQARTLPDWLSYIEQAHPRAWDLGLDRVRRVAECLDVVPPAPRNLVVAGTNGKGSTSVYAEALLLASGLSVGTTLSPHLRRFNERIRVDGRAVSDATVVAAFERIEAARGDVTLTYFEYGILAAFSIFRAAGVAVTVLEVGLGGRLDAVNVVDGQVTVITSIGLDHQDYLGHDVEAIGAEKAGILRRGVPCVFGEPDPPRSIVERAQAVDAPLLVRGRDFGVEAGAGAGWRMWRRGAVQRSCTAPLALPAVALANAVTALQAVLLLGIDADPAALTAAAATARLPGRFELRRYRDRECILDVAHNPHGARFLCEQLQTRPCGGRTVAVFGCLKDKDAAGIVAALDGVVDEWLLVDSGTSRGQSATVTRDKANARGPMAAVGPVESALARAVAGTTAADRIVVCGSFDVVRGALEVVGEGV